MTAVKAQPMAILGELSFSTASGTSASRGSGDTTRALAPGTSK
jgi:hypothetical protein